MGNNYGKTHKSIFLHKASFERLGGGGVFQVDTLKNQ